MEMESFNKMQGMEKNEGEYSYQCSKCYKPMEEKEKNCSKCGGEKIRIRIKTSSSKKDKPGFFS